MNNYQKTANKLKAMGHPVRLQILDMLREGEICVCHIEYALKKRQAYVSQQLMALRDAGLVTSRKDGLQVYYQLADEQIESLLTHLIGSSMTEGVPVLAGCNCPNCSIVLITEIK